MAKGEGSRRSRRRRRLLIAGALAAAALLGTGGAVAWTSRPGFCKSCHVMKRYYASWGRSKHAGVSCLHCHSDPGFLSYVRVKANGLVQLVQCLSGRFVRRPNATVNDGSCLRPGCHVRGRLDEGIAAASDPRDRDADRSGPEEDESGDGPDRSHGLLFRHADHGDAGALGIRLRCTTCHNFEEGERHFSVSRNACFLCHFHPKSPLREKVGCRKCHKPPDAPFRRGSVTIDHRQYLTYGAACADCHMQATRGTGRVAEGACLECHPFRLASDPRPEEIHAAHTGAEKVECVYCHEPIEHGRARLELEADLACTRCHTGAHEAAKRSYAASVDVSGHRAAPVGSPMFAVNIDCTACHRSPDPPPGTAPGGRGTVARARAEDCDRCHEPGSGRMLLDLIQGRLRRQCEAIQEEAAALLEDGDLPSKAEALIARAREACARIREDGSWGMHNPDLFHRLVREARRDLHEARAMAGRPLERAGAGVGSTRAMPRVEAGGKADRQDAPRAMPRAGGPEAPVQREEVHP